MAHYDDYAWQARDLADRVGRFGVELPAAAAQALHRLNELKQSRPEPPAPNRVATLLADNSDEATITAAVAAHVGANHLVQQHMQAQQIVGRRVLSAVLEHRDALHQQLANIAEPLIDRIHAAAGIDESIAELVKQRRMDDAHLLSGIEAEAAELMACYSLRDVYLTAGRQWSTGVWDCRIFQNPWDIENATPANDLWDGWRNAIRAGGVMWFPRIEEAHAASSPHEPVDEPEPIDPANLVRWH